MHQPALTPETFQRTIQAGVRYTVPALIESLPLLKTASSALINQCIDTLTPIIQGGSVFLKGNLPRPDIASALIDSAEILSRIPKFHQQALLAGRTAVTFANFSVALAMQICVQRKNPEAVAICAEFKAKTTSTKYEGDLFHRIQNCFANSGDDYSCALAPSIEKVRLYLLSKSAGPWN